MDPEQERRGDRDRRQKPTSLWDTLFSGGRRARSRRASEHRRSYFVDRFSPLTFVLVLVLLILTVIDGAITLHLMGAGCEEINPAMRYLLSKGQVSFLIGKYVLTAAGLPVLLIFKNYYLFGRFLRVGYLIPLFVFLYVILVFYQLHLLKASSGG